MKSKDIINKYRDTGFINNPKEEIAFETFMDYLLEKYHIIEKDKMNKELKYKEFTWPFCRLVCEFVNKNKVKVVSIGTTGSACYLFYYE